MLFILCSKSQGKINLLTSQQKNNLEENDMEDISEFVYSQNIIEKNADFTGLLLQLYYFEEDLENCEREIKKLSEQLKTLKENNI